jgi:multiple sugar transport system permease protein
VGLDNLRELVGDEVFWTSVRNSVVYAAVAVPLRLAGALGLALLLHRRQRGVGAERAVAYLPTVLPDAAYALVWVWLLNPLYGPLNLALEAVGIPGPAWTTDPDAAMAGIVLMSLLQVGEGFLVCLAVRQQLPPELYQLAEVEGAGPWQVFRRVTLPMMAPALVLLALRDVVFAFQATFVPALLVTGGGPPPHATTFLPLYVYRTGFEYLRYGYASAATLGMFVVTAVVVAVQWRLVRRWRGALTP